MERIIFDKVKAIELVKVQPMSFPYSIDEFYIEEYVYDLGNGFKLTGNECLRLIDWWNNKGGKEEYGQN